ncbi:hypothetical protein [Kribbella sp. NPDC055071]
MNYPTCNSRNTRLSVFLLTRTDEVDYEEAAAQVVIAGDADQARRIAMENLSKDQQLSWLDPQRSTCVEIATDVHGEPGHVLTAHSAS